MKQFGMALHYPPHNIMAFPVIIAGMLTINQIPMAFLYGMDLQQNIND